MPAPAPLHPFCSPFAPNQAKQIAELSTKVASKRVPNKENCGSESNKEGEEEAEREERSWRRVEKRYVVLVVRRSAGEGM
jgi:hypothetical protein